MNLDHVRLYLKPILIAGGALLFAVLVTTFWILHIQNELSTISGTHVTLQEQENALAAQITRLKNEKSRLPANCAQLKQEATEIPQQASTATFDDEINWLSEVTGADVSELDDPVGSATAASGGLTSIPVTVDLSGTFAQLSAFLGQLDSPTERIFQVTQVAVTPPASEPVYTGPTSAGGSVTPSPSVMSMTLTGSIFFGGGINLDICKGVAGLGS